MTIKSYLEAHIYHFDKDLVEDVSWVVGAALLGIPLKGFAGPPGASFSEYVAACISTALFGTLIVVLRRTKRECEKCRVSAVAANDANRAEYGKLLQASDKLILDIKPQVECAGEVQSTWKYFDALLEGCQDEGGRPLTLTILKLVDAHVWRIPNARAAQAYGVLNLPLEHAKQWQGIHSKDLRELTTPIGVPGSEDERQGKKFNLDLKNSKATKQRIIIRHSSDFERAEHPELLGANEKEDIRAIADDGVQNYFFDKNRLGFVLAERGLTFSDTTIHRRIVQDDWPDCAIYNGRFFVEYQRPETFVSYTGGEVRIWTTGMSPRDNNLDEVWVTSISRCVRALFRHLESCETPKDVKAAGFIKIDKAYVESMAAPTTPGSVQ